MDKRSPSAVGYGVTEKYFVSPFVRWFGRPYGIGGLKSGIQLWGESVYRIGKSGSQLITMTILINIRGCLLIHIVVQRI